MLGADAEVASAVAEALCEDPGGYAAELQMWPQTLPLVSQYLSWHVPELRMLASFLERVLAPFWDEHPEAVAAALLPHHAFAVSAACARCDRPDWFGMLLCALARARCRGEAGLLLRLLAAHLPLRGAGRAKDGAEAGGVDWVREVQNLALAANAAVKLDVHADRLDAAGTTALGAVAPLAALCCRSGGLQGAHGARSASLLAHAFGVGLLVRPPPPRAALAAAYVDVLGQLLDACRSLPVSGIRVRFQLLSALQCWWCVAGAAATLPGLRVARRLLGPRQRGGVPSAVESTEGQEWVSTQDHQEVARALPAEAAAGARMEEYAFPFWIDVVLSHHLYVLGTCECETTIKQAMIWSGKARWEQQVRDYLGEDYRLIGSQNMGAIHIMVLAHQHLWRYCWDSKNAQVATGFGNVVGNKGGTQVGFSLGHTSLLFINAHLPAHNGKMKERTKCFGRILEDSPIRRSRRKESADSPRRKLGVHQDYDRVFFMGDLNARVNATRADVDDWLAQGRFDRCLEQDELLPLLSASPDDALTSADGLVGLWPCFEEAIINFPPTYKFDVNTDNYDTSAKQRVPSWTDRPARQMMDA
ncbi:unnamed protein product [Prorocentrum cordatum]|uniref:Inositol polyphosphate-related phosphatase domain-containing protein n=1 Tax=Prorocentrum cordatum TaxID=2364126 RepID=A0ABN9V8N0_9DINO|nr:unnamed protein product [Polarella glacialis]